MTKKPEPTLESVLRDLVRVAEQDGKREVVRV